MTIEQAAARSGLYPRYLAGVERGEINLALENLLKACAALDVSLHEIAADADI